MKNKPSFFINKVSAQFKDCATIAAQALETLPLNPEVRKTDQEIERLLRKIVGYGNRNTECTRMYLEQQFKDLVDDVIELKKHQSSTPGLRTYLAPMKQILWRETE